jgi:hypothetical protein
MAAGAFALAITAVFATKANKKFIGVTSAESKSGSYEFRVAGLSNTIFTTTSTGGKAVYAQVLTTASGTLVGSRIQLYTHVSAVKPIYYK